MSEVTLRRQLLPSEITCPAGVLTGDASCHCNIEDHTVQAYLEPNTIEGFCAGDYAACSTWQAAKAVEARGGDLRRILDVQRTENSVRRTQKMLRDARLRAAQRLMVDPGPAGKAFRKKLRVGEFAP